MASHRHLRIIAVSVPGVNAEGDVGLLLRTECGDVLTLKIGKALARSACDDILVSTYANHTKGRRYSPITDAQRATLAAHLPEYIAGRMSAVDLAELVGTTPSTVHAAARAARLPKEPAPKPSKIQSCVRRLS